MCRSIKTLRTGATAATEEEIRGAALQFVRKVSGRRTPLKGREREFDDAVADVARATRALLEELGPPRPTRGRS